MDCTDLLKRLDHVTGRDGQWQARCPCHDDRAASLSIGVGDDGKILLYCQAGCETADILRVMGLTLRDLMPSNNGHTGNGHAAGNGKPKAEIVATYDYRDESGTLLYQAVRMQPKDFRQRQPKPGGGWNWSTKGVRRVPYRLTQLVEAEPDAIVFVCEGEKDADRLVKLGQVATCNVGGAGKWKREYNEHLTGRRVVVLPDADDPGRKHADQVAASLRGVASSVKVVELPGLGKGGDVSDWLDAGGTPEQLSVMAAAAGQWEPGADATAEALPGDDRPEIKISTREMQVNDQAIAALARRGNIYQRGGMLVQPVRDADAPRGIHRPADSPAIKPLPLASLREAMADSARWMKWQKTAGDGGDWIPASPPGWSPSAVHARGQWKGIPHLTGIVEAPTLRADGTVLQTPGYDEATGLLFEPHATFPEVPDRPTGKQVRQAVDDLLEVVEDFPFGKDHHRAAWLAGMLTPAARYAISGPVPGVEIESNVRSAGKGKATHTVAIVHTGRDMAITAPPKKDEDFRKLLTSLIIQGCPMLMLDNVAGKFGSPSLDACLTGTTWRDRILGESAVTRDLPIDLMIYLTANNPIITGDTARRLLSVRIESPLQNPEERDDFRHKDLLAWVRQERGRLASAVATILRAYHVAGRPGQGLRPWGSFEAWSDLVRSAIVWIGQPDPAETRKELMEQADEDATLLRMLIDGWQEIDPAGDGYTVRQAIEGLNKQPDKYETLRAAFDLMTADGEDWSARSIGMRLHHFRGRVVGDRYLYRRDVRMGALWSIRKTGPCGTNGTSGTNMHSYAHESSDTQEQEEEIKGEGVTASGASPASPASDTEDPATAEFMRT